ncbi:ribosomal protein L35 [Candidatus Hydrogenisulfobacillus filiaventi]|uniref:Large ribosomal subunit protein bL35 n=1 Tax=Candidatus Hydrogenisulfobacillus filiaventi TaxID=2707344 RepID=A0A6F8ZEH7_9FIRM|nr:ribosomal protein L35 [Candidatus Hydrogenisulfobacillus filiaventi]
MPKGPKMKTHRGAKKRLLVTQSGRITHVRANRSHLAEHKTAKRKRQLRRSGVLSAADRRRVRRLLPYA